MRLLNRGLYKIEHFNEFFHFNLKVRSLAVGGRASRSRLHHASHRMNVWHRTNVVVYLVIGLVLLAGARACIARHEHPSWPAPGLDDTSLS